MIRASNLRWARLLAVVSFPALASAPALAGNTHSEGGAVIEAAGVPETDGTATVRIYWTGDSAARTSVVTGTPLAGYWLQDAGFALSRQWLVGDVHAAVLERETGAGTAAHAGYYGAATKTLTSLDPDEFAAMTVRPIPVPAVTAGPGRVDLAWSAATSAGTIPAIAGYNLYRSTDGIAFTKVNSAAIAGTTYRDSTASFGTTYRYALGLVYTGAPLLDGTVLSASSAAVTPADATPPDVPAIAAEPGFTRGATNTIAWSSEAASGATAYAAECALDSAFSSLAGQSGWIADSTYTFSGLADGRRYFYRVRARDAAANASAYSAPAASRQDASPPASALQALAAFKASTSIGLAWTATDSVSGVAALQLYWSKDGGPYALYPGGPWTASPIDFDATQTGGDGAYAFYTLATDAVANAETPPETPDATTIVDTQPPAAPAIAVLPSFSPGGSRELVWSGAAASGATAYRIQASTADDFAVVAAESDWLADSTYTFTGLADGSRYVYRVRSRDGAGNESAWSALASSTQDASAPETAAESLPALSSAPSIDVAWAGSDSTSGLASVELWYAKDNGPYQQYPGGPWTASPIVFDASQAGGDGGYAFYTRGTDAAGNLEPAPGSPDATVTIDTEAPQAPAIAAFPAFTAGSERTISWDGFGASAFEAQAASDAEFTEVVAASGWIAASTHTFTGLADGQTYDYRVRGRDAAGNESVWSVVAASTQDASAPETAAESLPALTNATSIDVAWSGSDATSGLASVTIYWSKDGSPFEELAGGPWTTSPIVFDASAHGGDGTYAFYTRGADAVGNLEPAPISPDATVTIDTAAPQAPAIAALPPFTAGSERTISWDGAGASAFEVLAATDAEFTNVVAASGWIAASAHTFTGLADGQAYHYRVRGRDAAGNESGWSALASSTQDASAPETAAESLPAVTGSTVFDVAWAGSDATSGLAGVDLWSSKDGGPYEKYPGGPWTASPIVFDASQTGGDGDYALYTRGADAVGNLEAAPAIADARTTIDTAAPGAPAIAGMQTFTPGTSLHVAWSDESASGAVAYEAELSTDDSFASIAATSGWIADRSWSFTELADGREYWVRVRARDGAQNTTGWSGIQSTTMDATPPSAWIDPLSPATNDAGIALAWQATDGTSGLLNADLWVSKDGGSFELAAGGPFDATPIVFDASALGDGEYRFYVRARDRAGNLEPAPESPDASTLLDTTPPDVPALAALPEFGPGALRTLSWSDGSASGAAAYLAQCSADSTFATLDAESGWTASLSHAFDGLTDGRTYSYRVRSRDALGNMSAFGVALRSTQDASPPQSAVAALPALGATASLSLEWTAADATSGVAGVDLYWSKDGGAFAPLEGGPFTASPIAFDAASRGGDGSWAFYTVAHDAVGNVEPAPASPDATTDIDTAAPGAPALASLPEFTAGTAAVTSWNDIGAGTSYRAQVSETPDFTSILQETGWISDTSFRFTGLENARTYRFRVQARDAAGNISPFSAPSATTMDAQPPVSQLEPLPAVVNTTALELHWSGYDLTSGITGVDLYWSRDGAAFELSPGSPFTTNPIPFDAGAAGGEGQYAFYVRAHDAAGNVEPVPPAPGAETRVDTTLPQAPALADLPEFSPGSSVLLAWSNESASGAVEYLAETSTDPGFATVTAATGWVPVTSWTFLSLDDGATYHFRVKSRDAALNESPTAAIRSTTLDDTPPASAVSALDPVTTAPSFPVPWTGADATSGVASVDLYYARDDGGYTLYPGGPYAASPIAFDASQTGGDGSYAFFTRARDQAGNREPFPMAPDAQTIVSTSAVASPVLAALPAFTPGTSRALEWTPGDHDAEYAAEAATDSAFANVVAESGWIAWTAHTFTGLADGETYWYRVKARNAWGIEGTYSRPATSTQDATQPQSQAEALPPLQSSHLVSVAWTASDATSGVAGVRLWVSHDGGAWAEYAGGPYAQSPIAFDAAPLGGDGAYAFWTQAIDGAGNTEAPAGAPDASTILDTSAPAAPAMLAEPAATQGSSNTVAWTAAEGAETYEGQCGSDAAFSSIVASSGWITATSWTITDLETGKTYHYRVRARDAAGNAGDWSAAVASTQSTGYPLQPGWNLVSFNVEPADRRIDSVLASIAGSFTIVRAYDGGAFATYLPELPVGMNDLQEMDALHGYWIYMQQPDTLLVGGGTLSPATPISLQEGWNLAGYLPASPGAPSTLLASIAGACAVARGYEPGAGYSSWYPSVPDLSDLSQMRAGSGYWLYMRSAAVLVYGGLPKPGAAAPAGELRMAVRSSAASVPTVMDLWSLKLTLDGEPAPAGTVVEAVDAEGRRLATATVKQPGRLPVLHLPGDVSVTEADEGLVEGEIFVLRVPGRDLVLAGAAPPPWQTSGAQELDLEFVASESLLPKAFALGQNAPNPFNPTTSIAYAIPRNAGGRQIDATRVDLQVFDIRGRLIRTLVAARQAPGRYAVLWNGRDDRGRAVSAGVYFYRLHTAEFTQSRKMVLVP